jgi:hypothetical protein
MESVASELIISLGVDQRWPACVLDTFAPATRDALVRQEKTNEQTAMAARKTMSDQLKDEWSALRSMLSFVVCRNFHSNI